MQLTEGEWKTQERIVMNSNVGFVPLGSNICNTGCQLNKQSSKRINQESGRLCIQLRILDRSKQTSAFQYGNDVLIEENRDNTCVDGTHDARAIVRTK